MQLHKLNLHTASTPGFEPGGGRREHSLLPSPCMLDNCPIYQFGVYLEVKYSSECKYLQDIFLFEEEIGGLKKPQKLDQNSSPGVIKIGKVTSKTADRTQQPKAVKAKIAFMFSKQLCWYCTFANGPTQQNRTVIFKEL